MSLFLHPCPKQGISAEDWSAAIKQKKAGSFAEDADGVFGPLLPEQCIDDYREMIGKLPWNLSNSSKGQAFSVRYWQDFCT